MVRDWKRARRIVKAKRLIRERRYNELLFKAARFVIRKMSIRRYIYEKYTRPRLIEKMRNDTRFHIGDTWAKSISGDLLEGLLGGVVQRYEIDKIKLKDIIWLFYGHSYSLSDALAYKYLMTGDEETYRNHTREFLEPCKVKGKHLRKFVEDDFVRFKNTVKVITENGYDIRKGAIVVDERNVICDGLHRGCILWSIYGSDYEIPVLRIYYHRSIFS